MGMFPGPTIGKEKPAEGAPPDLNPRLLYLLLRRSQPWAGIRQKTSKPNSAARSLPTSPKWAQRLPGRGQLPGPLDPAKSLERQESVSALFYCPPIACRGLWLAETNCAGAERLLAAFDPWVSCMSFDGCLRGAESPKLTPSLYPAHLITNEGKHRCTTGH